MNRGVVRALLVGLLVPFGALVFASCHSVSAPNLPSGPAPEYEAPPARVADRSAGSRDADIEDLIDDATLDDAPPGTAGSASVSPPIDAGAPPP